MRWVQTCTENMFTTSLGSNWTAVPTSSSQHRSFLSFKDFRKHTHSWLLLPVWLTQWSFFFKSVALLLRLKLFVDPHVSSGGTQTPFHQCFKNELCPVEAELEQKHELGCSLLSIHRMCDGVWRWNKVLEILGNNVPRASTLPVPGEQRSRWTLPTFRASDSNQGFLHHRWTKCLRSAADEPGCTVLCNHVGIFKCLFSLTLLFWGFLHRNWGLRWGCWCVAHRAILVPFDCSCQKNKP